MNVLEGIPSLGSSVYGVTAALGPTGPGRASIDQGAAAAKGMAQSYGNYMRQSAERLRACGKNQAEVAAILSQGGNVINAEIAKCGMAPPTGISFSTVLLGTGIIALVGGGIYLATRKR